MKPSQALEFVREPAADGDAGILFRHVQAAMDTQIRPYLQAHGGDIELAGITDGVVDIRMFAACGACELKQVTFASRIRAEILKISGVTEVTCGAVPFTRRELDNIADFIQQG
jgi:Fe-S cluster biogenesis protein NfuA